MINVLHLSQTDIKTDSRILKEMHSISQLNQEINLLGIGVKDKENISNFSDTEFKIISINIKSRNFKLPKILIHFLMVFEITFKMFKIGKEFKANIIHCHDTPVLPLGVILGKFSRAKIIYDAHELESNRNGLNYISQKLTFFVEIYLWRFIDKLIVVSPSIGKWYEDNMGKKDTEVIMNSPMLEEKITSEEKNYFRNKFSIPVDSKIFLYIGILGKGRGIELVLNTFKNNLDLSSHLIFLGYGEFKDRLLVDSKNYKNIHVHDAVPHKEVVSIAKSADIGLCLIENISLSDYYCLPNKLFEYAFSEIPILASDFPDIKEVINKYKLGKYTELSKDDIYKAIKEFENEKELMNIDSSKLYDLSWQAQEEKLISLYNSLKLK
jgi:glycosyltransferase involved in cell wall biosynthesis